MKIALCPSSQGYIQRHTQKPPIFRPKIGHFWPKIDQKSSIFQYALYNGLIKISSKTWHFWHFSKKWQKLTKNCKNHRNFHDFFMKISWFEIKISESSKTIHFWIHNPYVDPKDVSCPSQVSPDLSQTHFRPSTQKSIENHDFFSPETDFQIFLTKICHFWSKYVQKTPLHPFQPLPRLKWSISRAIFDDFGFESFWSKYIQKWLKYVLQ